MVESQPDVAIVWLQEWRYLNGESRAVFVEERRRYEQRIYQVIAAAVQSGDLRGDLDLQDATPILLSVANWAYTWFSDKTDVDDVTARMMSILLSGMGPVRA